MRRLFWAVVAAATGAGFAWLPATAEVPAQQSCPPGEHEDAQTPGFQCVPGWCPQGSLLDGVTGTCVAAPGVPPPPLQTGL